MTDAIIRGNYSDLKAVKTRSVVQIIIEVPIEQGEAVVKAFGFPQPGNEIPVAIARMTPDNNDTEKPEPAKRHFGDMPRSQQAGMLCSDPTFQNWLLGLSLFTKSTEIERVARTANILRGRLGIKSRCELDSDDEGAEKWDSMVVEYRQATGQMAEPR